MSFVWFTVTVVVAGFFYPEYSHTSQFISELGATGSPHGRYVSYFGFIPVNLFILAFVITCFLVMPKTKKNRLYVNITGLAFIAVYGLTLGIAALFPCDFECRPVEPTISHNIHLLSAFPGYICGIISIFVMSTLSGQPKRFKVISITIGGICVLLFFSLDPDSKFVGVYQRSLEVSIYIWLIYFAFSLRKCLLNRLLDNPDL